MLLSILASGFSAKAANGVIMFGCSTTVVVAVLQRVYSGAGAGRHASTEGIGR